jgi:hypothetical protein
LQRGAATTVQRLTESGRFHLVMPPGLDHSLLGASGRDEAARTLTEFVTKRFVDERSA